MKKRLNYYVILLFASLSLISIGFASWQIADPNPVKNASSIGTTSSESVINSSDIIKTTIVPFEYFNTGFIIRGKNEKNEDTVILSDKGYIKITIEITDNDKLLNNLTSPTLNVTLYQNSSNNNVKDLLSESYVTKVTDSSSNDLGCNLDGDKLSFSCNLSNDISEITFYVNFDLSSKTKEEKKVFFDTLLKYNVCFTTLSVIGGTYNENQ